MGSKSRATLDLARGRLRTVRLGAAVLNTYGEIRVEGTTIPLVGHAQPGSVNHSQFIRMLPEAVQVYVGVTDLALRKERLQALAHWCGVYSMAQIAEVLRTASSEPRALSKQRRLDSCK
ncbi:hypothetical protein ACX93W_21615 [Paenibacillus sp. CAU 1782]